jgi:hypothetical protein
VAYFKGLFSQNLPGRAEKNNVKLSTEIVVLKPELEPGTYQHEVRELTIRSQRE